MRSGVTDRHHDLAVLHGSGTGRHRLGLADLMATFLCNHKIPADPAHEADLRTNLLTQWCETVWQLVAVNDGRSETKQ